MKGTNELKLSHDTMKAALQEYLTKRYSDPIKVEKVEAEKSNYGPGEFTVTVVEVAATVEEAKP